MFSKLILFLIMKQIFYINNYIVLPIYTLKRENYISPYELNSVKDIISTEFCSSLYTELEIGNPPQKIPLLVKMKTNDYVVTSIHPMIKNGSDYFKNKILYDFSENFMKNYNYYNENKSTTFYSIFVKIEQENIDMIMTIQLLKRLVHHMIHFIFMKILK